MSGFEKQTYTQVPNSLFSIMGEMDECEIKVVLYICRFTFGYHRDEVKISTRKLAEAIGMNTASVAKGADAAVARGLIEKITDGQNTTVWRAVVGDSEIESPAIQNLNQSDSEIESQVGVKERVKKDLNKPPLGVDLKSTFPPEWALMHGETPEPITEDQQLQQLAKDKANLIATGKPALYPFALEFITATQMYPTDKQVKEWRKQMAEWLLIVPVAPKPAHIKLAVAEMKSKQLTIARPASLTNLQEILGRKIKTEAPIREFPTFINGRVVLPGA